MTTSLQPARHVPSFGFSGRFRTLYPRFLHVENTIHHQLVKHSITALRIALGLVFFGFGILKYFPGVSPAQNVTEATTHILFLGLIPGAVAIKMIATLECLIGACLLSNRWMRLAVWLLGIEFIGILSPIFLLPARLFAGPHHAPTLLGQYCLKDIILVAGALVVTAGSFRGGRLIRDDLPPNIHVPGAGVTDAEQKLRIVLDGINRPGDLPAVFARHNITESDFHEWRESALAGAHHALILEDRDGDPAPGQTVVIPVSAELQPTDRRTVSVREGILTLLAMVVLRRR
jgi:putative oxidoreductase